MKDTQYDSWVSLLQKWRRGAGHTSKAGMGAANACMWRSHKLPPLAPLFLSWRCGPRRADSPSVISTRNCWFRRDCTTSLALALASEPSALASGM